jgi:uncharacterized protein
MAKRYQPGPSVYDPGVGEALDRLGHAELRAAVTAFRDGLRAHQERLNRLNVYPVPDGDTGTNMALTLESVVAELEGADDMEAVCTAVRHGSLMGARGNSGVILSQILRGVGERLGQDEAAGPDAIADALAAGSAAAYKAVMKPVEGTILTVARDAAEAATRAVTAGTAAAGLVDVLEAAAEAARSSVERTPELLPVLAAAGVVDAGGAGFVLLLDAFLHVTDGRPLPVPPETPAAFAAPPGGDAGRERADDAHGGGRYEVMYLLEAPDERLDAFKQAWEPIGDSIVVVGGDGLWNCHIHTDDVGAAVEAALDAGRPRNIRVTDLTTQVEEERWVRRMLQQRRPHAATAVVAVGAGDGVAEALRSLGAQEVVAGGQSANPSTKELLEAVEATDADGVVVLPNNKNVVPVAEGVAELAGRPVRVVPTTGLVGGMAALLAYDADADLDANVSAMATAAEGVLSGEVVRAVREASIPAGPVRVGDWLGLAGDEIVVVRPELAGAATALLERLVGQEHELVTVIEGRGASPDTTEAVTRWLAEQRSGVEVQLHSWGQPHAAYIFSVE